MAHSFGGILATEYAHEYGPTIRAMVYLNCTVNLPATARNGIKKELNYSVIIQRIENILITIPFHFCSAGAKCSAGSVKKILFTN